LDILALGRLTYWPLDVRSWALGLLGTCEVGF
jgi:hypothetical protein